MARTLTLDKKVLTGAGVAVLVFGAVVFGTGAASGAGAAEPVPAVTVSVTGPATTVTVTEAGPETTVEVPGKATTVTKTMTKTITQTAAGSGADPALTGSTCDDAREAILTGTQSGITTAMNKLVADKSADSTAREYARYYLGRDKTDKEMRELDIGLIQSACSL